MDLDTIQLCMFPELDKTTAQLDTEYKNKISHRGKALRQMWEEIKDKI